MIGIGIGWYKQTVGITGLRENFSRDRGIDETDWGPLNIAEAKSGSH